MKQSVALALSALGKPGLIGSPLVPNRHPLALLILVGASLIALMLPSRSSAEVSQQVTFESGWNLYSFWFDPIAPNSGDPEIFFGEFLSNWKGSGEPPLKLIYRWENLTTDPDPDVVPTGEWRSRSLNEPEDIPEFNPVVDDAAGFGNLEKYQAYWLYFEFPSDVSSYEFKTSGTLTQSNLTFKRGWNLMGLPLDSAQGATGTETQVDFESVLRGSRGKLTEAYGLNAGGSAEFIPLDTVNTGIPNIPFFLEGSFVSGTGNWFFANKEFSLEPKLRTVFAPDSDFGDSNLAGAPNNAEGDIDRNRYFTPEDSGSEFPALGDGVIENGEYVRSIVFRFQPADGEVEEVIPFTITNRGTVNPQLVNSEGDSYYTSTDYFLDPENAPTAKVEAADQDPDNDGQGILAFNIRFRPIKPEADVTQWRPDFGMPSADDYLPSLEPDGTGGGEYGKDSPYRTWLQVLIPEERNVRLPDGRIDPIILNEAKPLAFNPITGFVSNDVAGITLLADRTGLPINTQTSSIDSQGATEPIAGFGVNGELVIESNAGMRRVLVRCEVPPLAGMFEGVAYINKLNGVDADPAFPVDLSLSLFEDASQKLRGIIDSERVLLYPRDVPLTGTKLTSSGSSYVFTGSFFLPPGDINRAPFDQYFGLPENDTQDVDHFGDNTYDNTNPLPYQIERSMAFFVDRESDNFLTGRFIETLTGLTEKPISLEGDFELIRISYDPRKRDALSWSNSRRIEFDPTGTTPEEEIRSTIEIDRPLRIDKVNVTLGIDHPRVEDLDIRLLGPDLTEYEVFPFRNGNGDVLDNKNFDGDSGSLYEVVSSDLPTNPDGGPLNPVIRKQLRTRQNPRLGALKGITAGSATLYGSAMINGELQQNVPALLDSRETAKLSRFSDFQVDETSDPPAPDPGGRSQYVEVTTQLFSVTDAVSESFSERFPFACTDGPDIPASVYDSLLSSGDPLEKDSIVSVLVSANPVGTDWLNDINAYRVALSYPSALLQFDEVVALPACGSEGNGTNQFPDQIFRFVPKVEKRVGSLVITASDLGNERIFKGGALFVARFRVKAEDLDYNIAWSEDVGSTPTIQMLPMGESSGVPLAIPLTIPVSSKVTVPLAVRDGGRIQDLELTGLSITHPAVGKLKVSLRAPSGSIITLMEGEGGNSSNISGLTFDDEAENSILAAAAPFNGRFRPQQPLEDLFDEDTTTGGIWSLVIENTSLTDQGKLNAWGLSFDERLTQDYAISLAAPPSVWTLVVKDSNQGPVDPVPPPRLVRWGLSIETSGGSITGRVVDAATEQAIESETPVRVSLLGREFVPSVNVPDGVLPGEEPLPPDAPGGSFRFTGQEFGIYTIAATHPDYLPVSTRELFFESTGSILDIGTLRMVRRVGPDDPTPDDEEDAYYELIAKPWEATVLYDNPETPGDESTSTTVRLELVTQNSGITFNQGDKLVFTVTPWTVGVSTIPLCPPASEMSPIVPNPSIEQGTPGTPLPSVVFEAPLTGSIFGVEIPELLAGTYTIAVQLQDSLGMPKDFPNSMTDTIEGERFLIIRSNQPNGSNDTATGIANLSVLRYSFGTGTSNRFDNATLDGCFDVMSGADLQSRPYFLRDQAGFDIDRPSTYFDGIAEVASPGSFGTSPDQGPPYTTFPPTDGTLVDPQDSWQYFTYDGGIEDLYPDNTAAGSTAPGEGSGDNKFEYYSRKAGGNLLRWRAAISFNSQVFGVAFGTIEGQGIEGGNLGTILAVGEMPLIPVWEPAP